MGERILLVAITASHEFAPFVYLARPVAFALIIGAIIDKNRRK